MPKIKLFISDIDGTLTDGTVFVSERGEELKQFSHRDGRGIYLLNQRGVKTCFVTTEAGGINAARSAKLLMLGTLNYFQNGISGITKLDYVKKICEELKINIEKETAFIGDDTNDKDLFSKIKYIACPKDAVNDVKKIKGILKMKNCGGYGAVREFIDYLIRKGVI